MEDRLPAPRTDLNLFRVFLSVMRHRNLAAAGRELGISASAVSHALTRMRAMLKDDLFVAGPRCMVPTTRAMELLPGITLALTSLDKMLASNCFDTNKSQREFRIAATDHVSVLILPELIASMLRKAPNIRLKIHPVGLGSAKQLDQGELDVILGSCGHASDFSRRKQLLMEREVLVVRRGHPLTRKMPVPGALHYSPDLFVDLTGNAESELSTLGFGVDCRVKSGRFPAAGLGRDLVGSPNVSVPSFALAATLVRSTDLIARVPERLALHSIDQNELSRLDLPFQPPDVSIDAVWHERGDHDASLQWLIGEVTEACRKLEPLPEPPSLGLPADDWAYDGPGVWVSLDAIAPS